MKLYLVRHASANMEDPEKRLSTFGVEEAKKMAAHLAKLDLNIAEIFHSEKARAKQTAGFIADAINANLNLKEKMQSLDNIEPIANWINYSCNSDLMLVGHMPFMSKLASYLMNGDEQADIIQFGTAAIMCLEKNEEGRWLEHWMIDPESLA